ncbi:MAG: hypothetical protein FJ144_13870 [Deltaproteobacteria bacterium]|nr:hypothetical protein [Deltaproteobacteria bacterium]
MRRCDLCGTEPIARVAYLGDRSDRRIWLCAGCFQRHEDHELLPEQLLALARCTAQRSGKCEWCGANPPAAQVRVVGAEGRVFAFHLCTACAQDARGYEGTRILHPQAALEGEATVDPRYERAVEIARRRRRIKRLK